MTTLEEAYEAARERQRAASRALMIASSENRPASEMLKLISELDQARRERKAAFAAWMEEDHNEKKPEGMG